MNRYPIAYTTISVIVLGLLLGCSPLQGTTAPEDVIPLAVPGFTLIQKNERMQPFEGDQETEYSASSLFSPKEGSIFQGKVAEVQITVFLFRHESDAITIFEKWAQVATKIKVKGVDTLLVYDEQGNRFMSNVKCGKIAAIQQRGKLIIYSVSLSPTDWDSLFKDAPAPTFDKEALHDAAIQCLEAIRL